jgi:phage major head subunit gpT-like protein
MQITPQTLRDLRVALNMLFMGARARTPSVYADIATRTTAQTKTVSFPQHASTRRLRRWEGERKVVNGRAYDYRVTAEKFELTMGIPVEEIEDDNIGAYNALVEDMGEQVALWPDDLVFGLLLRGEDAAYACFDGKAFFANDHELKSGSTIDNLITSNALTKDNVAGAIEQMMSWVGEDGRSLRVRPNLLVVPPALQEEGLAIVGSNILAQVFGSNTAAAGVDNTMKGRLALKVYPELGASAGGSDTDYYLFDTTRSVKPLVFVERSAPKMTFKNQDQDDNVFWDDEVVFGVRARGAAGWGPFHLGAKCKA